VGLPAEGRVPRAAAFSHPGFDLRCASQLRGFGLDVASIYVPGGKDFGANQVPRDGRAHDRHGLRAPRHLAGDWTWRGPRWTCTRGSRRPSSRRSALLGGSSCGVDLGRALDPDNEQLFTWWPPWRNMRERNIGWRLDYVLASAPLAARALRCPAFREVGTSDHGPVLAEFEPA
jgi:exodeoxyribonuclease-3